MNTTNRTNQPNLIPQVQISSDNQYLLFYNGTNEQQEILSAYIAPLALIKVKERYEFKSFEFIDYDKKLCTINIPLAYFSGSSERIEVLLRQRGFDFPASRKRRTILFEYLTAITPRLRLGGVAKYGWAEDLSYFNYGGHIITKRNDLVNTLPININILLNPDIARFNQDVAPYLTSNNMLIIGLCATFVAPLLKLLNIESFGIHYYGSSSSGKSLITTLAGSIIGNSNYVTKWQSTANGIEGLATNSNDLPLILDEMSQFKDYSKLEATIMMLINGVGTARLNKNAELMPPPRWSICVISTGNQTPMLFTGGRVNVAADIRIFNIPANTPELGVLNELHKFKTSYEFVKYINKLAPNPIFHEYLTRVVNLQRHEIPRLKQKHAEITQALIDGKAVHGQVFRVAEKFAAMQLAGELATELEIWALPISEIQKSIKIIFESWVAEFGSNDKEHEQILEQFISGLQSRLAKFIDLRNQTHAAIPDPLFGYYDDEYFYLTAHAKNVLLEGFNMKYALEVLQKKNLLLRWQNNSFTKVKRIGDRTEKLYHISRSNLTKFLKEE